MAEKEKKEKIDERQLVVFKLAAEEFGVEISEVKEIIKMENITPVPNVEDYILGIINLRGKIIVIVSLAKKLSLSIKNMDKDTRIIISEIGESSVGMAVDSVEEVLRVTSGSIAKAPEIITNEINAEYINGVCVIKERLIILLNLVKLFSVKEFTRIEGISEANKSK